MKQAFETNKLKMEQDFVEKSELEREIAEKTKALET